MPFTKENLQKLSSKEIQTLRFDKNNKQSPTHLESQLKFALCQIYGLHTDKGIHKNVQEGLEAIFNVWLAGGKRNGQAFQLLSPSTFEAELVEIKKIVAHYRAIPQNERNAKTNVILGILYLKAIGVTLDAPFAFGCFKKAADEQNFPPAQLFMAEVHFLGFRRTSDPKTANDWLITKDLTIAASYLCESAKQFPRAQSRLGSCYLEGKQGFQKNLAEAVFWLSKAYENGIEDALPKLERARLELQKELELLEFGEDFDNLDKKSLEFQKGTEQDADEDAEQDRKNFEQGIFTQQSEISPTKNFKRSAALMLSNNGNNAAQATTNNNNVSFNNKGATLYRATNFSPFNPLKLKKQ